MTVGMDVSRCVCVWMFNRSPLLGHQIRIDLLISAFHVTPHTLSEPNDRKCIDRAFVLNRRAEIELILQFLWYRLYHHPPNELYICLMWWMYLLKQCNLVNIIHWCGTLSIAIRTSSSNASTAMHNNWWAFRMSFA